MMNAQSAAATRRSSGVTRSAGGPSGESDGLRHMKAVPFADMPMDEVSSVLAPDDLLPVFSTPATMVAWMLHRMCLSAGQRNVVMLRECEACLEGEGHLADDAVGVTVDHVAEACKIYMNRYEKRMELLQRYNSDTTERSNLSGRAWSQRVQDFYERPFASKQGVALFLWHVMLFLLPLISMTLQTIPQWNPAIEPQLTFRWQAIEVTLSFLFLADILLNAFANFADPERPFRESIRAYVWSLANVLDVVAMILPTIQAVGATVNTSNAFLLFRLVRMYRIFRGLRHFYAFEDLFETLKRAAFPLVGPVVAVLIFVVGFASLVYTMEAGSYMSDTGQFMVRNEDCESRPRYVLGMDNCPRVESKFLSIFHSMWFALIALLTIGYGDMVPLTMSGRLVSLVCIVIGQLLMAMPIAIIGNNFTTVVASLRGERSAVLQYMNRLKKRKPAEVAAVRRALGIEGILGETIVDSAQTLFGATSTVAGDDGGNAATASDLMLANESVEMVDRSSRSSPEDLTALLHLDDEGTAATAAKRPPATVLNANGVVYGSTLQDVGGGLEDESVLPVGSTTLPSVMFLRFLQYGVKHRMLTLLPAVDLSDAHRTAAQRFRRQRAGHGHEEVGNHTTTGIGDADAPSSAVANRLVSYVTEVYLRHCALRYLEHCRSKAVPVAAPAPRTPTRSAPVMEMDTISGSKRLQRSEPGFLLLHAGVPKCFAALPTETTLLIGSDPYCDILLNRAITRTLAALRSHATAAEGALMAKSASFSVSRRASGSFVGSFSSVAPVVRSAPLHGSDSLAQEEADDDDPDGRRVAASLSIRRHTTTTSTSHVHVSVSATGLSKSGLFLNGRVIAPFTEAEVTSGASIQMSLAANAPKLTLHTRYPYPSLAHHPHRSSPR